MVALCIATTCAAGHAYATVVSETFSGTIAGANTIDTDDRFGQGDGANLAGQTITISYSYDTSAAATSGMAPTFNFYDFVTGGITVSAAVGSASTTVTSGSLVTINSEATMQKNGSETNTNIAADNETNEIIEVLGVALQTFQSGVTINAPITPDPTMTWHMIIETGVDVNEEPFTFDDITVTTAPEPTSLAVLVAGILGLAGLRRRAAI